MRLGDRGALKQALLRLGWLLADEAGFDDGDRLADVELTAELRSYQGDALAAWRQDGSPAGGSGVLALPCGAGKTVIGLGAVVTAGVRTLIVCTSISAARQWITEILDKTTPDRSQVGEWSGQDKNLRDVTLATYQVLTWSDPSVPKDADLMARHPNLRLFDDQAWGLVIYDEVHLLPAPVFRATARIQAVRRLGLTATLIREDGREGDVFSLIGPKRFDARGRNSRPWGGPRPRFVPRCGWSSPTTGA